MRLIFKRYEVRDCTLSDREASDKYEVVLWNDDKCSSTCIAIAFLEWDGETYCLRSVGGRFLQYCTEGLPQFLMHVCEFLGKMKELSTNYDES